jgi:ABC-type nitrate/sulfonate/bicarbonate transport system permease component
MRSLAAALRQAWLPAVLVAAWWYASSGSASFYFPPLSEILAAFWTDVTDGPLLRYTAISLGNVAVGLVFAAGAGVALGLVIGQSPVLRTAMSPTLNFLRAIPPASIVPIIIVALGVGSAPKIFIIALGCFWPILLNTIDGVRAIPASVRDTASAYRIPRHLQIRRIALPGAMPQIMAGFRIALAVGLVLMVIGEFFGADAGIGFYITDASTRFSMRQAWAGTIYVGALGYLLSAAFLLVERRVLAWYFQDAQRIRRTGARQSAATRGAG